MIAIVLVKSVVNKLNCEQNIKNLIKEKLFILSLVISRTVCLVTLLVVTLLLDIKTLLWVRASTWLKILLLYGQCFNHRATETGFT